MSHSHLAIDDYNFYRHDRLHSLAGGGVALYVKPSFSVKILATSDPRAVGTPEFMIVEIKRPNLVLLFAVVYRPPDAISPSLFFSCLAAYLPHYSLVVVTGDFNANIASNTNPYGRALWNLMNRNALKPVSLDSTCHHVHESTPTHTTLDLFIVRMDMDMSNVTFGKTASPFMGVHDLIELTVQCSQPQALHKQIRARNLVRLSPLLLNARLSDHFSAPQCSPSLSIPTHDETEASPNVNALERVFSSTLLTVFDELAPVNVITLSSKRKPWVTP